MIIENGFDVEWELMGKLQTTCTDQQEENTDKEGEEDIEKARKLLKRFEESPMMEESRPQKEAEFEERTDSDHEFQREPVPPAPIGAWNVAAEIKVVDEAREA